MAEVILTGADRRTAERKYLRCRVQISVPGVGTGEAKATDISVGGMGILADYVLKAGVWLRVCFSLHHPDGSAMLIDLNACVMHCVLSRDGGYKIGLQFKDVSPAQQKFIERYIKA